MKKEYKVSQSIEIDAKPETCYEVICDYENYPSWHKHVRKVIVKDTYEDGRPMTVQFLFDIAIKQGFKIVIGYGYDDENYKLLCKAISGDFSEADASFSFRQLSMGRTLAVYDVNVSIGFVLPVRITNYMIDKVMKGVLVMLKEECEKKEKRQLL